MPTLIPLNTINYCALQSDPVFYDIYISNIKIESSKYRKLGIRSRGYYFFHEGWAAALIQGRLLLEGGFY